METQPADLALSDAAKETFATTFGVEWSAALGSMVRNDEAMARLDVDGLALEPMWRTGVQCKLAPGTYVSRLEAPAGALEEPLYTLNGFYPAMRHSFVSDGAEVRYLVVEWEEEALSWASFRSEVIGATNPHNAVAGSARAELLSKWRDLGLPSEPTFGQNGVHASAGPLEGLKERLVWAGAALESDAFATALMAGGVDRAELEHWLEENAVVTLGGETDKVFDLTEEMGSPQVLALCTPAAAAAAVSDEGGAAAVGAPPQGFEWGGVF
jgi:hypothetical protein